MEQIFSFELMENPLVSVICLCYNQERFVKEALDSVIGQSYSNIQLIVVDDASTDGSKEVILEWLNNTGDVSFVDLAENAGSTTAFNKGLALAHGDYVIDLAGDDILVPERIERQVNFFDEQSPLIGVIYSNAQYINEEGKELHEHFEDLRLIPFEGDIYERAIDTYFIPTPTMMIRKKVLDDLGGYDESLAYEDFDFWIRSARKWHYAYQSEVLTLIRKVKGSHSTSFYEKNDRKLISTLTVCYKILDLNKTNEEVKALIKRLKYEIRHAFLAGKKTELSGFFLLWRKIERIPNHYLIIKCIGQLSLNLSWLKRSILTLFR
ncbi:glycosyltransferase [Reichenbachiella sp.]|uniref:glycosyltransferase n=1 Tax=Reichenbachiella sp. TaxID=2184521 RepID=UPI003298A321